MAGIGFELRRAFGKKTLMSGVGGMVYAFVTTIGPSLVFIILMMVIQYLLRYYNIPELDLLFFMSSFTYIFAVAIIISGLQNTVVSRYISDKIFQQKEEDICASLFGSLTFSSCLAAAVGLVIVMKLWRVEEASWIFLFPYYAMFILSANAYTLVTYVSALKKYKEVTLIYISGIVTVIPVFLCLYLLGRMHIIVAVYWGLMVGFAIISMLLVWEAYKAFGEPSRKYFEFLIWYKKYPKLTLSGFAYILGFYISNFIYWITSDMVAEVSIFRTTPVYDLAVFAAVVINLSGLVIFEVKTETVFYERYIYFMSMLEKGTYDMIEKAREMMQNSLNLQLFFVYEVQLIITIISICLVHVFHPYLGLSSEVLRLFLITGMGIYCTLCMYFTIIFLYYFEDHKAACIGPCIFLCIVVLGSLMCGMIWKDYYGVPLFIGAITGWIISFVLLRRRLKNLTRYLFCR